MEFDKLEFVEGTMEHTKYTFKRIGLDTINVIRGLFSSVFTAEPWNDDWSNQEQLDLYLNDLVGQKNSLTYGLYENDELIAVSMGYIKHWYTGTEYAINELCVQTDKQGHGIGNLFLKEIEKNGKEIGLKHIFLQTERSVPAYYFYQKNGFLELEDHVSFSKEI